MIPTTISVKFLNITLNISGLFQMLMRYLRLRSLAIDSRWHLNRAEASKAKKRMNYKLINNRQLSTDLIVVTAMEIFTDKLSKGFSFLLKLKFINFVNFNIDVKCFGNKLKIWVHTISANMDLYISSIALIFTLA